MTTVQTRRTLPGVLCRLRSISIVGLAVAASVLAACGDGEGAGLRIEALGGPSSEESYVETTYLGFEEMRARELPPVSVTEVDGGLIRTASYQAEWMLAIAEETNGSEGRDELAGLLPEGPIVTVSDGTTLYLSHPELLAIDATDEAPPPSDSWGTVRVEAVESSGLEVVEAVDRMMASAGTTGGDPLELLVGIGAELEEVGSDGQFVTYEACIGAVDMMVWLAGSMTDDEDEIEQLADDMEQVVSGDLCWTIAVDDEQRVRQATAVIDFVELVGRPVLDMPSTMTFDTTWDYPSDPIEIPSGPYVDVTDAYLEALAQVGADPSGTER